MRKTISIKPLQEPGIHQGVNLAEAASVELTSEDPRHPIENALIDCEGDSEWRAASPGAQRVCIRFDKPTPVRTIELTIEEHEHSRSQEFVIRAEVEHQWVHVVRQRFNFSPPGTSREIENFRVQLDGVTALELRIDPDSGTAPAFASLKRFVVK